MENKWPRKASVKGAFDKDLEEVREEAMRTVGQELSRQMDWHVLSEWSLSAFEKQQRAQHGRRESRGGGGQGSDELGM